MDVLYKRGDEDDETVFCLRDDTAKPMVLGANPSATGPEQQKKAKVVSRKDFIVFGLLGSSCCPLWFVVCGGI